MMLCGAGVLSWCWCAISTRRNQERRGMYMFAKEGTSFDMLISRYKTTGASLYKCVMCVDLLDAAWGLAVCGFTVSYT